MMIKAVLGVRLFASRFFIERFVSEVDHKSGRHHDKVNDIKAERDVLKPGKSAQLDPFEDLAEYAADVTHADKRHKQRAGTLSRAGFVSLDDVERPGRAETDDHYDFENRSESF